ncbi:hypothetical protein SAMN04490248_1695 [Salinihabitans flavidus]|uniref:DUF6900 domain-containing protein n=1 Tax=Salinihabitans flavidus TaxID=569882 RepID=A0A1H8WJH5_9RHOB|nr:hypothetical protein [Salinihabitans flavidus]SEP27683.1 hypothetical protein SAMN04490248_1695 [Salinihabitans flavidus]
MARDTTQMFEAVAREHLFVETLETRNRDALDFTEVSVWGIRAALEAAFEAGRRAGNAPRDPAQIAEG